MYNSAYCEHL